jgi:hypothetical protein
MKTPPGQFQVALCSAEPNQEQELGQLECVVGDIWI